MNGPIDDPVPPPVDLRASLPLPPGGGHCVQRGRVGHDRVRGAAGKADPGRDIRGARHRAAGVLPAAGDGAVHRARLPAVRAGVPDAVGRAAGHPRPAPGDVRAPAGAADDVFQPPAHRGADVADHARRHADRARRHRRGVHRPAAGPDAAGADRRGRLPRLGAGGVGAAGAAVRLAVHRADRARPAAAEPAGAGAHRRPERAGGGGAGQHPGGQGLRARGLRKRPLPARQRRLLQRHAAVGAHRRDAFADHGIPGRGGGGGGGLVRRLAGDRRRHDAGHVLLVS